MSWGDLKSGVVLWDPTILVQVLKLPKTGKRWSAQNFWTFKVRANRALFRVRQLPNRSRAAVQVGGYVLSSADTGLVAMWCSRAKGESWHGGVDLRIDSYDQPNQAEPCLLSLSRMHTINVCGCLSNVRGVFCVVILAEWESPASSDHKGCSLQHYTSANALPRSYRNPLCQEATRHGNRSNSVFLRWSKTGVEWRLPNKSPVLLQGGFIFVMKWNADRTWYSQRKCENCNC